MGWQCVAQLAAAIRYNVSALNAGWWAYLLFGRKFSKLVLVVTQDLTKALTTVLRTEAVPARAVRDNTSSLVPKSVVLV